MRLHFDKPSSQSGTPLNRDLMHPVVIKAVLTSFRQKSGIDVVFLPADGGQPVEPTPSVRGDELAAWYDEFVSGCMTTSETRSRAGVTTSYLLPVTAGHDYWGNLCVRRSRDDTFDTRFACKAAVAAGIVGTEAEFLEWLGAHVLDVSPARRCPEILMGLKASLEGLAQLASESIPTTS